MDDHTLFAALVAGGVVCILAAIVGGGLSVHVVSIPALPRSRQVILAIFGLLLVAFGLWKLNDLQQGESQDSPPETQTGSQSETPPADEAK